MEAWISLHLTGDRCMRIRCPSCNADLTKHKLSGSSPNIMAHANKEVYRNWQLLSDYESHSSSYKILTRRSLPTWFTHDLYQNDESQHMFGAAHMCSVVAHTGDTGIRFKHPAVDKPEERHQIRLYELRNGNINISSSLKFDLKDTNQPSSVKFDMSIHPRWFHITRCTDTYFSTRQIVQGPILSQESFKGDLDCSSAVFLECNGDGVIISFPTKFRSKSLAQVPDLTLVRAALAQILKIDNVLQTELTSYPATPQSVSIIRPGCRYRTVCRGGSSRDHNRVESHDGHCCSSRDASGKWALSFRIVEYLRLEFTAQGYGITFRPDKLCTVHDVYMLALSVHKERSFNLTFNSKILRNDHTIFKETGCRHGDVIKVEEVMGNKVAEYELLNRGDHGQDQNYEEDFS